MALSKYPTEIPPETWTTVIGLLRGEMFDANLAVHCIYDVIGFGLYSWDTSTNARGAAPFSRLEAANMLESLKAGQRGAKAFPWSTLIPLLLTLIQEWLTK